MQHVGLGFLQALRVQVRTWTLAQILCNVASPPCLIVPQSTRSPSASCMAQCCGQIPKVYTKLEVVVYCRPPKVDNDLLVPVGFFPTAPFWKLLPESRHWGKRCDVWSAPMRLPQLECEMVYRSWESIRQRPICVLFGMSWTRNPVLASEDNQATAGQARRGDR